MNRIARPYTYSEETLGFKSVMARYKHIFRIVAIAVVILLSAFGIWKALTSPGFAMFLADLKKVLGQTNLLLFALAVGIYLLSIPAATLSWNGILKAFGKAVPLFRLIPILMAGVFANNITPMSRAGGEVVRAYGLREKFKMPYTIALISVALNRLTEVIPIVLMGIFGGFALVQGNVISWQKFALAGAIGCAVTGIFLWMAFRKRYLEILWGKILGYLLRKEQKLSGDQSAMAKIAWTARQKRAFGESILFGSVEWILALVRLKILAYALGFEISFSVAAAATVWYIVMGLFALTPGGVGIVDGGLVAGFMLMGVPPSQAFALTVLERAISYLLSTTIGAICLFTLGGKRLLMKARTR